MVSAEETGKGGVRSVRAGLDAVTEAVRELPLVGRKVFGRDGAGKGGPSGDATVHELPDAVWEQYLSVLVWLVHVDDDQIDERELCEIQVLTTRLRCGADVRRTIRSHLEDPSSLDAGESIARMLELLPEGMSDDQRLALKCSLMKDAIRVSRATSKGSARGLPAIHRLARLLRLDADKVAFLEEVCEKDEKILKGEISDSHLKSAAKDLLSRAASVGVPVTAVYLSGSVAGLSAAGITSGLAALGLGGVLGLSAMATGIGAAILMGGVTYKGLQWVLGGSARKRGSIREMMLQEVLRTHQRAIIHLGQDMASFGERIAELSWETERNRNAIGKLSREVTLLSRSAGALTQLGDRATGFENDLREAAARREGHGRKRAKGS